jgi:integrase
MLSKNQFKGGEIASRICPECHSKEINKCGFRETRTAIVQRYVCKECGYRFSESSNLSTEYNNNVRRQICVTLTEGTKNLTKVETRTRKALRESTNNTKSKVFQFAWYMKKQGYADGTIETYVIILKVLKRRGADLNNPESVKEVIAKQKTWSKGRQWNVCKAYTLFLKMQGKTWEKPRYKPVEKTPFILTEQEIDSVISACSKQLATFLQVAKETGARRGEIFNITWDDIDFVQKNIRITPEKGSKARVFKMSDKLIGMLHNLPKTQKDRIWIYKTSSHVGRALRKQRKRIAHKLGNPRLKRIHCHMLRYWKGSIEYVKTKDPLYVQKLLGHRNLKMTLRYIQLISLPQNEDYICKTATSVEEAKELIEAGFEYVTDMDSHKLFRKRKTSYLGSESFHGGPWSSLD